MSRLLADSVVYCIKCCKNTIPSTAICAQNEASGKCVGCCIFHSNAREVLELRFEGYMMFVWTPDEHTHKYKHHLESNELLVIPKNITRALSPDNAVLNFKIITAAHVAFGWIKKMCKCDGAITKLHHIF